MNKAVLSKKDQILHKLVLYEVREQSGMLDKYIAPESLLDIYSKMVEVNGNHIFLKNVTKMDEYNRLSFFFESIIHDYCKAFRVSEDEFKTILLDKSNSLSEFKKAVGYYETQDAPNDTKTNYIKYENTPVNEVGYRRRGF